MAIEVTYRKRIPYPFARVLSQYFDLEHIETVHPTTLGSYRAIEVAGNRIVFEQRWPSWLGLRLRSVVEQVWLPPNRIRIRFRRGFLRGRGRGHENSRTGGKRPPSRRSTGCRWSPDGRGSDRG